MQIIIIQLISLASVGVMMKFRPYIRDSDNNLAIIAQWSITLVLFGCLIIRVSEMEHDGGESIILGVVLILLNLGVIAFAIISVLYNTAPKGGNEKLFDDGEESEDEEDEDECAIIYDDNRGKEIENNDDQNRENNDLESSENDTEKKVNRSNRLRSSLKWGKSGMEYTDRAVESKGLEMPNVVPNPLLKTKSIDVVVIGRGNKEKQSGPVREVDSDDEYD